VVLFAVVSLKKVGALKAETGHRHKVFVATEISKIRIHCFNE
jgi:hypothetical protein